MADAPNASSMRSCSTAVWLPGGANPEVPYLKSVRLSARYAGTATTITTTAIGTMMRWHTRAKPSNEGMRNRCSNLSIQRRHSSVRHGMRNMTVRKLNRMPFASTMPMFTPMPNCMTVSERKPKNVTAALDSTTEKPRFIACAMAT